MKCRKKSIVIEAFEYDGDLIGKDEKYYVPKWAEIAHRKGTIFFRDGEMYINTLEGKHHVSVGDYVIKGISGELYPCKPEIFRKTYEILYPKSIVGEWGK